MLNILPTKALQEVNMLQKTKKSKSVQGKILENTLTIWLKKLKRAADFGNMKIVYSITKQLSGKYNKRSGETVKAKDGKILITEN